MALLGFRVYGFLMKEQSRSEESQQKKFVRYLRSRGINDFIHVPNEQKLIGKLGHGTKAYFSMLANMKAMGASPGVPDLLFLGRRWAIELKRDKSSRASPAQKSWIEFLVTLGWKADVAYGFDDAVVLVERWIAET